MTTFARTGVMRKALSPNGSGVGEKSWSITGAGPGQLSRSIANCDEQSLVATANGRRSSAHNYRSHTMHLLMEELSRDRMRQTQRDLESIRLARRLRSTRKHRRSSHRD